MKFTLTYEDELRANDSWRRKWEIRKHFHPQLQELWRVSPAIRSVQRNRYLPKGGFWNIDIHHSQVDERRPAQHTTEQIDLLAPITVADRMFLPLVRDSLALQCALKIV